MTDFNKYAQEANEFLNRLGEELGHSEEREQTTRILKAVLHTVRDRITISENLDLLAQLPMFLKALYVHQWKYQEKPDEFTTMEGFTEKVKERQKLFGEQEFDWEEPTREIILTVIRTLYIKYLTTGELEHVISQLPKEVKETLNAHIEG